MSDRQSAEVLLIDSNPEDVQLFLDALEDEKIANKIYTVADGAEALDFLHQRGEYTDASRPNLILLDVDLPEMDGHDLLEKTADDPNLAGVPVIVLTSSDNAEDVAKSYELHANAYVQKPVEPSEFIEVVRTLEGFWLDVVWLPLDEEDESD